MRSFGCAFFIVGADKMKKIIPLLAIFILILTGIISPASAYAQDEIEYETADISMFGKYSVSNNMLLIAQYNGEYENIYIPETMEYNGKTYKVAVNNTFDGNKTVKNILFDEGIYIKYISTMFNGASNLETIRIKNGGHFLNESTTAHTLTNTFKNCYSLKEYFDLSEFNCANDIIFSNCVALKDINSLPKNAKVVQINNYLKDYNYTSTELERISTHIPESCTSFLLRANSVSGNIVFDGNNTNITISSASNSVYLNETSLTLKVPANSETLRNALRYVAQGRNTINVETIDDSDTGYNEIFAVGDSLTAGNYYIPQLNNLLVDNSIVYNYGIENDQAVNGLRRMGVNGYEVKIAENFTIPESKNEAVEVKLTAPYTRWAYKIAQDSGGVNAATISGVKGIFSYDKENNITYFRRLNNGEAVNVSAGSEITTQLNAKYKKGQTLLVYLGTNDVVNDNESHINDIADSLQALIDYCECKNYIVVGIATGSCSAKSYQLYENIMYKRFNDHFLNTREYFIENAYSICNDLTIDEEEQAQLDVGTIPAEFYNDGLHWKTTTGGKVLAQAIYEKLLELGYIYDKPIINKDIDSISDLESEYSDSFQNDEEVAVNFTMHPLDKGFFNIKIDGEDIDNEIKITVKCSNPYDVSHTSHTVYSEKSEDNRHTLSTWIYCSGNNDKSAFTLELPKTDSPITVTITGHKEHTFDGGVITKQPSCTEEGEIVYTCTSGFCKAQETKKLEKNKHIFSAESKYCLNNCGTLNPDYTEPTAPCNPDKSKSDKKQDTPIKTDTSDTKKKISFVLKTTKIKKAKRKKKSITLFWKKAKGVSGYEIQYARNKKFTKNKKTVIIKKSKIKKRKITNLAKNKTYYIRIRTYKKIGNITVYSEWSKVKKVKIK